MDPATLASLAGGPAEAASRRNQESGRVLTDRIDKITCHRRFGDSDSVPIAPYDELAPDTLGTPAYRYVLVTAMRNHAADGQSGTDLARHWLASDPEARVPDIAALGLDDGDIVQRLNGVERYTRIRAVDANLALTVEYGGPAASSGSCRWLRDQHVGGVRPGRGPSYGVGRTEPARTCFA